MIGLMDLSGQGLVLAALEGGDTSLARFGTLEDAKSGVRGGAIDALILESGELDAAALSTLAALAPEGVPTLVVTRNRSVTAAVEALRAGASDYLASPFEFDSLLRAVERLGDESGAAAAAPIDDNHPFVTQDAEMRATLELLRSIAASDATILIEGESGTGKELLARMLHLSSPRRARDLITINCAALPPGLLYLEPFISDNLQA